MADRHTIILVVVILTLLLVILQYVIGIIAYLKSKKYVEDNIEPTINKITDNVNKIQDGLNAMKSVSSSTGGILSKLKSVL